MNQVVRPYNDFSEIFGNFHTGKAASKRLLFDMRMGKDTGSQNRSVRRQDLPFVRKVLPTLIRVAYRHIQFVGISADAANLHLDDICFPGKGCRGH